MAGGGGRVQGVHVPGDDVAGVVEVGLAASEPGDGALAEGVGDGVRECSRLPAADRLRSHGCSPRWLPRRLSYVPCDCHVRDRSQHITLRTHSVTVRRELAISGSEGSDRFFRPRRPYPSRPVPGGCAPRPPLSALNGPRPQTPDGLRVPAGAGCRDLGVTGHTRRTGFSGRTPVVRSQASRGAGSPVSMRVRTFGPQVGRPFAVQEEGGAVEPVQAGCRARRVHRRAAHHRGDVVGEQFAARARGLQAGTGAASPRPRRPRPGPGRSALPGPAVHPPAPPLPRGRPPR